MDLYVKELALLGVKSVEQFDTYLTFKHYGLWGKVHVVSENFIWNGKDGNGLGELKEMVMMYERKKNPIKKQPIVYPKKVCPNMAEYEALLNELGIYYDKLPMELIIMFEGYPVKIFPKSHWFTGRKVRDGRGLENLRRQLTKYNL